MKSTYKLFGTVWDGIDSVQGDSGKFKITGCREGMAIISFAKLLSTNNTEEIDAVVSGCDDTSDWLIEVDYWCSRNKSIASFLEKRLNQMVAYLERTYGKTIKYSYSTMV